MYLSFMFLYSVCIFYSICSSTSFGVNGTWVRVVFVAIFAISVDPPRLTESLRTRLNQARAGQEVITLVTIVVTTETTSLPGPSRSQLRERKGDTGVVAHFPTCATHLTFEMFLPLKGHDHGRPSPNAGRLWTSDEQTSAQISGYADGLWCCTKRKWLTVSDVTLVIRVRIVSEICAIVKSMQLQQNTEACDKMCSKSLKSLLKFRSHTTVCQSDQPWCIGVWMSMPLTETTPPCFSFTVMSSSEGKLRVTERVHTASWSSAH